MTHNVSTDCTGVILVGGKSRRMGVDKARLRLGGRTLLARVREHAAQLGFRVRVVRKDLVPPCGPLGGIYTAMKRSRADALLFLSCDMPFVTVPGWSWSLISDDLKENAIPR